MPGRTCKCCAAFHPLAREDGGGLCKRRAPVTGTREKGGIEEKKFYFHIPRYPVVHPGYTCCEWIAPVLENDWDVREYREYGHLQCALWDIQAALLRETQKVLRRDAKIRALKKELRQAKSRCKKDDETE